VASALYLLLMAAVCIFGPLFTGHDFTTIYRRYVRVPPSLPHIRRDQIEAGWKRRCGGRG
jgi:oligopeptide transport system permease protein